MVKKPETLGKYKIIAVLGEGSMGIVYKAIDPDIQDYVALKTIHKHLLEGKDRAVILQRLINEVKAGRLLRHPNIVAMYDYQEDDDICFLVMEYVEGKTLKQIMQDNPIFNDQEIYKIMNQLLDGLQAAHNQGVIHRDIKPENLILKNNGDVRIADFGIARLDNSTMTIDGSVLGSPAYMSPEQCMGKQVDARSDLFSAGVVLYQLLTGEKPFFGMTFMETMQQILHGQPLMPTIRNQDLEIQWDAVVTKALAKHVDQRFQTAADFQQGLTDMARHQLVDNQQTKPTRWLLWLKTGIVFSVLIGCGYWWITQNVIETSKIFPVIKADNSIPLDQQLNQLLTDYECDELLYTIDSNNTINVSGYVSVSSEQPLHTALSNLAATSNQRLDIKLIPIADQNCELLSILQPFVLRNNLQKHGLQIEPNQHESLFVEGERPIFEVITPDFPGYLYVDYFMADGNVFHLLPTSNQLQQLTNAERRILIGKEGTTRQWEIVKPYGKEIMSVIVSDHPLFDKKRDEIESSEAYSLDLRLSLFENENTALVANYFVITTISQVDAE
ncbi:MAG: serine/threonine-protein kinase [Methylococcales bacterium]